MQLDCKILPPDFSKSIHWGLSAVMLLIGYYPINVIIFFKTPKKKKDMPIKQSPSAKQQEPSSKINVHSMI